MKYAQPLSIIYDKDLYKDKEDDEDVYFFGILINTSMMCVLSEGGRTVYVDIRKASKKEVMDLINFEIKDKRSSLDFEYNKLSKHKSVYNCMFKGDVSKEDIVVSDLDNNINKMIKLHEEKNHEEARKIEDTLFNKVEALFRSFHNSEDLIDFINLHKRKDNA